jgi:hypothetical protein
LISVRGALLSVYRAAVWLRALHHVVYTIDGAYGPASAARIEVPRFGLLRRLPYCPGKGRDRGYGTRLPEGGTETRPVVVLCRARKTSQQGGVDWVDQSGASGADHRYRTHVVHRKPTQGESRSGDRVVSDSRREARTSMGVQLSVAVVLWTLRLSAACRACWPDTTRVPSSTRFGRAAAAMQRAHAGRGAARASV